MIVQSIFTKIDDDIHQVSNQYLFMNCRRERLLQLQHYILQIISLRDMLPNTKITQQTGYAQANMFNTSSPHIHHVNFLQPFSLDYAQIRPEQQVQSRIKENYFRNMEQSREQIVLEGLDCPPQLENQFPNHNNIHCQPSLQEFGYQKRNHLSKTYHPITPISKGYIQSQQIQARLPLSQSIEFSRASKSFQKADIEKQNSNLPLKSTVKIGNIPNRYDYQSSQSDTSEQNTKISKNLQGTNLLLQSFMSEQIYEQEESLIKCQNCQILGRKNAIIIAQNSKYARKINQLVIECWQLKNSGNSQIKIQIMSDDDISFDPVPVTQDLVQSMRGIRQALIKISKPGFDQLIDFNPEEKVLINETIRDMHHLKNIVGKQEEELYKQNKIIYNLHQKYKTVIYQLHKHYQQKIFKINSDFNGFMLALNEKQTYNKLVQGKCLCKKKDNNMHQRLSKTVNSCSAERQNSKENVSQLQRLKEQVQLWQFNFIEQKKKLRILEKQNKLVHQKYAKQIAQLINQKNYYAFMAKKRQIQFEQFMMKLGSYPQLAVCPLSQLFKRVSLRIFQISNSIPFQDNDEQNLFTPDNQEELFQMIERIRRFSLKVEEYTAQKDKQFNNMKNNVTIFIKKLVETNKISVKFTLQLIKSNKDLHLDYLKGYLLNFNSKTSKNDDKRMYHRKKNNDKSKSTSMQKLQNCTFLSDQIYKSSQSQ